MPAVAGFTCYLAGPMRGFEEFNFPTFHAAAANLRKYGWDVWSPAERDEDDDAAIREHAARRASGDWSEALPFSYYMAFDLKAVCERSAVVCLPGWEKSQGARLEAMTAVEIGHPVWQMDDPTGDYNLVRMTPEYVRDVFHRQGQEEPQGVPAEPGGIDARFLEVEDGGDQYIATDAATGGQKGRNLLRFGLIPWSALRALARHYGMGAFKYDDDNWRKGYSFQNSIDALERHLSAFKGGESFSVESFEKDGVQHTFRMHHLIAVAWHAFTLYVFERDHLGTDDRKPS